MVITQTKEFTSTENAHVELHVGLCFWNLQNRLLDSSSTLKLSLHSGHFRHSSPSSPLTRIISTKRRWVQRALFSCYIWDSFALFGGFWFWCRYFSFSRKIRAFDSLLGLWTNLGIFYLKKGKYFRSWYPTLSSRRARSAIFRLWSRRVFTWGWGTTNLTRLFAFTFGIFIWLL